MLATTVYEVVIIIPILHMKKLRHRENSHTTGTWGNQDLKPVILLPNLVFLSPGQESYPRS